MFEAVVVVVVVDWALLRCAARWCNHTQDSLHTAASPGESVAEGNFSAVNLWKNCGANYFLRTVSPQWWTRECFAAFRDRMSVFVRFVRVCVFVFIDVTDISVWVLKPAPTSELQPSNATVTILIESHTVLQIVQDQMLAWGKRRHVWTFLYLVFLLPICFLPAFVRALKKSPKTIDLPNCSGFGAADGVTVSRRKNKRRPTV